MQRIGKIAVDHHAIIVLEVATLAMAVTMAVLFAMTICGVIAKSLVLARPVAIPMIPMASQCRTNGQRQKNYRCNRVFYFHVRPPRLTLVSAGLGRRLNTYAGRH